MPKVTEISSCISKADWAKVGSLFPETMCVRLSTACDDELCHRHVSFAAVNFDRSAYVGPGV